jgi:hypothetical protein
VPPPLPKSKLALLGGIVERIDPIRNRLAVRIHGGEKLKLIFDQRTRITRNGEIVAQTAIKKGDRVYLDTQNVDGQLFAKQIQVVTNAGPADLNGHVVAFDAERNEVTVRDNLSSAEAIFHIEPDTAITHDGRTASAAQLLPGSIIAATFAPAIGRRALREVRIIALPG